MMKINMDQKRSRGQFYTLGNPFALKPFFDWAKDVKLRDKCVLEPFAGANNIIKTLRKTGLCRDSDSYDLNPAASDVKMRDAIKRFPKGYDVCVTNPPWLARNSATRRGIPFCNSRHDDLYKHCLELCLKNCKHVATLLPASYLQSRLFQERLQKYILLHDFIFTDTQNPVCLALFGDSHASDICIYHDDKYIGKLADASGELPHQKKDRNVRFNDPQGALGFISFDNVTEPSIRFCHAEEVQDYPIKVSSRFITRISGNFGNVRRLSRKLNKVITEFRETTNDLLLTPFKGMRKDGKYRRRMDFALAKRFINAA